MSKNNKDYISLTQLKEIYPNNDYIIIGEIPKKDISHFNRNDRGEGNYIKPIGYHKQSQYKIVGYLLTEHKDQYVAVLKDVRKKKILLALLLVIAVVIGGYFLWQRNQGPVLDPALEDYVSNLKRPDDLDETRILIPGYSELKGKAGSKNVSVALFNPADNPCYFQFTIVEKTKNDELYASKLIPPGKGIKGIQLNKEMPVGTYDIVIHIKSYDLNDYKEEFNGAEVEAKLIIEK